MASISAARRPFAQASVTSRIVVALRGLAPVKHLGPGLQAPIGSAAMVPDVRDVAQPTRSRQIAWNPLALQRDGDPVTGLAAFLDHDFLRSRDRGRRLVEDRKSVV